MQPRQVSSIFQARRGRVVGTLPVIAQAAESPMIATLEELKSTLSGLPAPERTELIHYLLHTPEGADEGAAGEWLALAERRLADVRTGRVVGIPAEKVMKSLWRPRTWGRPVSEPGS